MASEKEMPEMGKSIGDYYEEFLRNLLAEKNVTEATITSYRSDFEKFKKFLAINQIEPEILTLSTRNLKSYFTFLKIDCAYANGTIRRRIHSLSSFFKFLLEMEYIDKNPMLAVHAPTLEKKLPIYLKQNELEKLLEAPNLYARFPSHVLRDKTLFALLIYTGARRSEIIGLDWKDVDFKNETITIHKGKGKKERVIPLLAPPCFYPARIL